MSTPPAGVIRSRARRPDAAPLAPAATERAGRVLAADARQRPRTPRPPGRPWASSWTTGSAPTSTCRGCWPRAASSTRPDAPGSGPDRYRRNAFVWFHRDRAPELEVPFPLTVLYADEPHRRRGQAPLPRHDAARDARDPVRGVDPAPAPRPARPRPGPPPRPPDGRRPGAHRRPERPRRLRRRLRVPHRDKTYEAIAGYDAALDLSAHRDRTHRQGAGQPPGRVGRRATQRRDPDRARRDPRRPRPLPAASHHREDAPASAPALRAGHPDRGRPALPPGPRRRPGRLLHAAPPRGASAGLRRPGGRPSARVHQRRPVGLAGADAPVAR